jgi:sporulation protein YlmC with PRC-barrel domain
MTTTSLSASTLTGDTARNPEGDKLGHLAEIVIDLEDGRVNYGVLATGGFLGLGEKYFAIPWDLLGVDTVERPFKNGMNTNSPPQFCTTARSTGFRVSTV